ncbi:hypothetical protein EDC04DRAFT_2612007 [Pisolithus marmoratus]|nr:hypothetical protein EDC04DRAFT_2612007 [Pisolithus marmoratus]
MTLQLQVTSVFQLVASTILCYDYLLTLRREVDFFWMKPRRSWMFVLFVANRYLTILGRVPAMVATFWPRHWGADGTFCKAAARCEDFVVITVQLVGGIVMIIRVYALYMKSRRLLLFLVLVILAGIGLDLYQLPRYALGVISKLPMKRMAITWSGQLAFDAIVFVLTAWRTLHGRKPRNRTLLDTFIRDGALYFGLMTGANAANITALLVCNTHILHYGLSPNAQPP